MPRQRARVFRTLGAAHGAARPVRGQPRRLQRRRHLAGRAALWPEVLRPQREPGAAEEAAASAHPVLGLQPLPHPGRLRSRALLSQRPVHRPPYPHRRGIQRGLHRDRAAVRAGARIRARRRPSQHHATHPALVRRHRERAGPDGRLRADARAAGLGDTGVARHIRGPGAGRERAVGRARGRSHGRGPRPSSTDSHGSSSDGCSVWLSGYP